MGTLIAATICCNKSHLAFSFTFKKLLDWIAWMNGTEFGVVTQNFLSNFACHSIFCSTTLSIFWSYWLIPFRFLFSLFLCLVDSFLVACIWLFWFITDLAHGIGIKFFHFFLALFECCFFGQSSVPLICHLFLPPSLSSNFIDSVFDDCKSLSNFVIFHVLLVIQLISKLKQIIDFCLLCIFLLLFCHCPCWFLGFGLLLLARCYLRNNIVVLG